MPVLALQSGMAGLIGSISAAPALPSDPPNGWTLDFSDDFIRTAQFGMDAVDPAKWKHRNYGTGLTHGGSSRNNNAQNIESTGTTVRVHTTKVGTQWYVDGFQMGVQFDNPAGYGYHPGYGEFHSECRMRFSHGVAPGVGGYHLWWQADNEWGSEIDVLEMPGRVKNVSLSVIHYDSRGLWDLGSNNEQRYTQVSVDLTQWHVWKTRRTYSLDNNGNVVATVRIFIDDVEIVTEAPWKNNRWLTARMVPGFSSYTADPAWTNYSFFSSETPLDTYTEIDQIKIWVPGIGSVQKSLSLAPIEPGTLTEASAGAGVPWTTTVYAYGAITSIDWVVVDGAGANVGSPVTVAVSGSVNVTPTFTATGQRLKVTETGNAGVSTTSGQATVQGATQDRSIELDPENPGTRAAGAMAFTVTTVGIPNITWVVYNSAPPYAWTTGGNSVDTTGSVVINPVFTATGQVLKVFDTADTDLQVNTEPVTIV